jgi:hypothetical protein
MAAMVSDKPPIITAMRGMRLMGLVGWPPVAGGVGDGGVTAVTETTSPPTGVNKGTDVWAGCAAPNTLPKAR